MHYYTNNPNYAVIADKKRICVKSFLANKFTDHYSIPFLFNISSKIFLNLKSGFFKIKGKA